MKFINICSGLFSQTLSIMDFLDSLLGWMKMEDFYTENGAIFRLELHSQEMSMPKQI